MNTFAYGSYSSKDVHVYGKLLCTYNIVDNKCLYNVVLTTTHVIQKTAIKGNACCRAYYANIETFPTATYRSQPLTVKSRNKLFT